MGDRPLAHIEKVVSTYAIEGADQIVMTQVLDYHVITKKSDDYKVGDLLVYIEVDSILPDGLPAETLPLVTDLSTRIKKAEAPEKEALQAELAALLETNARPEFEFLRSKNFRIKALKMRGVISQGIMFPLSILPGDASTYHEGQDVTAMLGITKVVEDPDEVNKAEQEAEDEPAGRLLALCDRAFMRYNAYRKFRKALRGEKTAGKWHDWMPPKSDEVKIQNVYSKMWWRFGDDPGWFVTEKLEGQSMAIWLKSRKSWFGLRTTHDVGVCSRERVIIRDDGSRFWATAEELDFKARLLTIKKETGKDYFIRGEHCGGKIQKNIYGFEKHGLWVYDVWDIAERRLLNFKETEEFCQRWGFDRVPVLDTAFALKPSVNDMLDYSNAASVYLNKGKEVMREGVVIRRKDNSAVSFKIRSPEYLIKHGL